MKDTAVFLDQELISKGGSVEDYTISLEEYNKLLNNFFDMLEKKTNLEVVIALHPRNKENLFLKRKCYQNKTCELVRKSNIVIAHYSTAISFAVLFYKPILFLTCNGFKGTWTQKYIETLAVLLNRKIILLDH